MSIQVCSQTKVSSFLKVSPLMSVHLMKCADGQQIQALSSKMCVIACLHAYAHMSCYWLTSSQSIRHACSWTHPRLSSREGVGSRRKNHCQAPAAFTSDNRTGRLQHPYSASRILSVDFRPKFYNTRLL